MRENNGLVGIQPARLRVCAVPAFLSVGGIPCGAARIAVSAGTGRESPVHFAPYASGRGDKFACLSRNGACDARAQHVGAKHGIVECRLRGKRDCDGAAVRREREYRDWRVETRAVLVRTEFCREQFGADVLFGGGRRGESVFFVFESRVDVHVFSHHAARKLERGRFFARIYSAPHLGGVTGGMAAAQLGRFLRAVPHGKSVFRGVTHAPCVGVVFSVALYGAGFACDRNTER